MKRTLQILVLTGTALAAGCATRYQTCYPTCDERTVFAIGALYDDTRVLAATNGIQRYVRVPDTQVVAAAEALLLHYSQSVEPEVRNAAACRLAHFGTRAALSRALELAHDAQSAEARAGIWSAIAELLQSPLTRPLPEITPITGLSEGSADTNLVQILASPDLRIVVSCWHKPADFILPTNVPIETIESEIINQYATDTGEWSVAVVDKIPFVPFSARHYTVTQTVRQVIADTLQWTAHGNERILEAFQKFSRDQNDSVREPARGVVEALSPIAVTGSGKSTEDRTSH
ncbi:MAG: hypothetical protein K8T26_00685 [Lentisphaerae bacterium]|nr:hypothetical protein [Lentisphaerota bacterium]